MPFVSITRLRVRHWRLLPQFLIPSIRIARQAQRQPETSPFQSFATLIGLSGPGRFGGTRQQCGPSCNRVCIAELWRGCRNGAMRPPSCVGGKTPRNRRLGRNRIAA
jgi:hypothetical protein